MIFKNNSIHNNNRIINDYDDIVSTVRFENESWFIDLQKLSNDELMRMYNIITIDRYEFAKNAWYIPLEGDKRCPIMIAKGYKIPRW